ncbi:MAG: CpsD/CapB family tyrosine-protein kinase [Gammaproteobacteria bacterium]|jgi:capsular exopolysaccharide synthesis family protein|nr:CpsD/CapB family tyrosine-protein kinase [Gammaproteobacteria bacterium]MDP6616582.1 CpsD/CapB family tyrosine-protein kinase [Gammaproteobacteria bacterium]
MERIRQAVEQASRDRETKAKDKPEVPVAPAPKKSQDDMTATQEIRYTQTRRVDVSPALREEKKLVAAIPGNPLQDTYRMLRTRVFQELAANDWNTIAVTSPATASGKTLTAINLAITIAMDVSHTALLIDADLRHPAIHDYFGYTPEFGLNDYLDQDIPLSSILFHPNIDRLTVMPGREAISESAETLRSPKMVTMMKEIKNYYSDRIIVLDVPPVLTIDDALAFAPSVDCMLLVAEYGSTSKEELREAIELLEGIPIIGTVLNKTEKKVGSAY